MKKWFVTIFAILLCVALALPAAAVTVDVPETDFSIDLDSEYFYIFTRENLAGNPKLEELGLTEEYMAEAMQTQDIYLDALTLWDEEGNYIELLVTTSKHKDINQLSDYSDKQVQKVCDNSLKGKEVIDSGIFTTDYKFINAVYADKGIYLNEYATIVNGTEYVFKFQSSMSLTDEMREIEEDILETIQFRVDPNLKNKKVQSTGERVMWGTITGAAAGGIAGGVVALIRKKRTKE